MKKCSFLFLVMMGILLLFPIKSTYGAGKVVLSSTKLTMTQGTIKTLKLKNNNKKVEWKVITGSTYIKLQNKRKTGVEIAAKKKGNAKVQAQIGKKKYVCTVNVTRKKVSQLKITVKDKVFTGQLYDNVTTRELIKNLPITIIMKDLNRNEKYYNMKSGLPTKASIPSKINAGDIMLYGNDCLVFFYESFQTSYSYTPIGKITNSANFKEALGNGSIKVTIQAN